MRRCQPAADTTAPSRPYKLWPFDEASLLGYLRKKDPTPRALIQHCAARFQDWLEGGRQGLIYLGEETGDPNEEQQFLRMWNAELEKVREDPEVRVEDYPVQRLQRAIREALSLARESLREMAGLRVKNIREDVVRQVKSAKDAEKRYSFAVEVESGGASGEVVVPVTDLNNSRKFTFYLDAVTEQVSGERAGALLVHRVAGFEMGSKAQQSYDREVQAGRLRLFALEENLPTLERLECLVRFLDRAGGRELQVGPRTLTVRDCQAMILETAVLDNLDLFRALGRWKKFQAPPPRPAPAPAVPAPPAPPPPPPSAAAAPAVGGGAPPAVRPAAASALAQTAQALEAPPAPQVAFNAKYGAWAEQKLAELVKKLTVWGQAVQGEGVEIGPGFARLKVVPSGSKTTINRIRDKAEDVKIHLGLGSIPLIDSQASHISVDVQLPDRRVVRLSEALASPGGGGPRSPSFPAGVDVSDRTHWIDLSDTADCHLLVAGQTGSGKSEFLRAMVAALARRLGPEQLRFVLIDPKRVTFNLGTLESPYLQAPVALDTDTALPLLEWCLEETRRRYGVLAGQKKTNVADLGDDALIPRVVVVIDEFANLLEGKESRAALTSLLKQIGSMSRAAGVHLVLATQRPDKDVVTPLLRDNLPGRVALQVKTEASSKLIVGAPGAAYLLGKGDLLWQHGGGLLRLQCPLVTQAELEESLRAH